MQHYELQFIPSRFSTFFSAFLKPLTSMSQQVPEAQVAFKWIIQVFASQQGFSQCSANPQSHSSPGSVNPLPQVGPSYKLNIRKILMHFSLKTDFWNSQNLFYSSFLIFTCQAYYAGSNPCRGRMHTQNPSNCMNSSAQSGQNCNLKKISNFYE